MAIAAAAPLERDRAALAAWLRGRPARDDGVDGSRSRQAPDPEAMLAGLQERRRARRQLRAGRVRAAALPGAARVARYAQGRDYHKVMGRKLKELAAWLTAESGAVSRTFVDTGPVLERAWAERAGLGWIGKNANLLTRDLGSWILLGEVLTCAVLEADAGPHQDFCGTCTACLDACPTQAIESPGVVDSNACISVLDDRAPRRDPRKPAQRLGRLDLRLRRLPGRLPLEHIVRASPRPTIRSRIARTSRASTPMDILGLDEAAFRARYSGTSLMRARYDGMRRNACVVLGNRGDPAALPALRRRFG